MPAALAKLKVLVLSAIVVVSLPAGTVATDEYVVVTFSEAVAGGGGGANCGGGGGVNPGGLLDVVAVLYCLLLMECADAEC